LGTLFSAFDIGRSGLQVAQVQLDVAGNNIANVNKEGFSRQRVELLARMPVDLGFGQVGRGVQVGQISRLRETFLDFAYRRQNHDLGRSDVESRAFQIVQDLFLEPTDNGFSGRLSQFFAAATEFSNNVESIPVRQSLLSEGQALADSLRQVTTQLADLRTDANAQIISTVAEINSIAVRIDELNHDIVTQEVGNTVASVLRDERDLQLDRLSRLASINVRELTDGSVSVLIGNSELVSSAGTRELVALANPTLDPERPDLVEVRDVATNTLIDIQGGELFGALNVRDNILTNIDSDLDTMAAALIQQVNAIHSQGNGLENLSGTTTGGNAVSSAATALVSAGLPFTVTAGSFDVVVYDNAGNPTTTTINITGATTLTNLATALNGVANLTATVTPENRLQITSAAGFTYSFANDSSGALNALGVNGFFTGFDARTIGINQTLVENPALVSSSFSSDVLNTGDNTAALAIANVQATKFLDGGLSTVGEFYQNVITELGVDARTVDQTRDQQVTLVDNFDRRRQEVSGVNIDEEVTALLQFQRAFEASARVITTVDRMLETLLNTAL
jgi:flagellar hook-associated protein 1 FlgK